MNELDHDVLIGLQSSFTASQKHIESKIGMLCNTMNELKADIKEIKDREMPCAGQLEKCQQVFKDFDRRLARRSKWGQLITVWVILIGIVSGIVGYNFSLDAKQFDMINRTNDIVIRNQEAVEHFHKIPTYKHNILTNGQ
jgi:hypothetical protein